MPLLIWYLVLKITFQFETVAMCSQTMKASGKLYVWYGKVPKELEHASIGLKKKKLSPVTDLWTSLED